MNQEERDRLVWLRQARKQQITQREAAERMEVSERWVRKLLARMRVARDRVVVHGLRGRPSNRKLAVKTEQKAMAIVRAEYSDFGPTLAAEYLSQHHDIAVSRETMRQWMMRAGIWKRRQQRLKEIHVWRQRRSAVGELVQWDTSEHDWLEGRGERIYYIAMIDDASGRVLARFVRHDGTAENMQLLWSYLERYGRPVSFYTDRDSMFQTSRGKRDGEEQEMGKTQIGRALEELGIGWIGARSPQAKGRVERHFDTAQDRLVKGLRKARVHTLEGANEYLEKVFLPWVDQKLTREPAKPTDAHRPLGKEHNLGAILSWVEHRVVGNDYTVRIRGQRYQIDRREIRPGLRGATVRVEQRLDGTRAVRLQGRYLTVRACEAPPARPAAPLPPRRPTGGRKHDWNRNFDLHTGPKIWQVMETSAARPPQEGL